MSYVCVITDHRAAFEDVSRVTIPTFTNTSELVDIRKVCLPRGDLPSHTTFDPRKHREPRTPITPTMAYYNVLRSLCGAGMLGLPLAVSQAGIILGPILCLVISVLIIHTHMTLLECLNEICRHLKIAQISYRYGFRIALLHGPLVLNRLGDCGPTLIAVFMVMSQLGICSVIVILSADSLRDIMDWDTAPPALMILFLPYMLLEFFMKDLKIVSYVSLAGNFLGFTGLVLIFYLILMDPHGETIAISTSGPSLLFAIGTFLFNISLVGVILSLDKSLYHPGILVKCSGPLVVGVSVASVICSIYGSLGYWSFGTMEDNVLRLLPYDNDITMVIFGLYLVTIAFSYPLQSYPGVQIVLEVIKNLDYDEPLEDYTMKVLDFIGRPLFVVVTFVISYLIPFQAPFVAFVGNLCTTLLALVFPALMELCLRYPRNYGRYYFYLIKNVLLIVLGMTSWTFGVLFSVKIIYTRILASRSPMYHLDT